VNFQSKNLAFQYSRISPLSVPLRSLASTVCAAQDIRRTV
jgi:hypothetical protein